MNAIRNSSLTLAFVLCSCIAGWTQSGTPIAALEEMATASKIEDVEKHLPIKFQQALDALTPKEKAEFRGQLLLREKLERDGLKLHKSDDGMVWEVVHANGDGEPEGSVTIKNSFVSGNDAFILLQAKDNKNAKDSKNSREAEWDPNMFGISMRLEEGEWRVTWAGGLQGMDFESEEFLGKFHPKNRDSAAAASTLRTLNTCIITYETTYPKVGAPPNLQALTGTVGQEASPEHAMLLDPSFMASPIIKDGYEFRYTLIDPGIAEGHEAKYRITATPVEFSKTSKSFFTDESAVIRFTTENREANESDPPL
jgi:hypothetical protein